MPAGSGALDEIKNQKALLLKYAEDSANEKKAMRQEMANLEDELRRLRDNLSEIEIENQSYQVLQDAEK